MAGLGERIAVGVAGGATALLGGWMVGESFNSAEELRGRDDSVFVSIGHAAADLPTIVNNSFVERDQQNNHEIPLGRVPEQSILMATGGIAIYFAARKMK